MRIELEIKNKKLHYNYEVGSDICEGNCEMNADLFTLFSKCLEMCIHSYSTGLKSRRMAVEERIIEAAELLTLKD